MENHNIEQDKIELESLRAQVRELRNALNEQEIFSERAMRKAMAGHARFKLNFIKFEKYFTIPFIILIFLAVKFLTGVSWIFVCVTILICSLDVLWDLRIHTLRASDYVNLSLVELRCKVLKQKRERSRQMVIEIPLLVPWIVWFSYELAKGTTAPYVGWVVWAIILAVAFTISLGIVLIIYKKLNSEDDAILGEIDKLENIE